MSDLNEATTAPGLSEAPAPATNTKLKEIDLDGYKFQVDTDLLDDVEAFEYIDKIESKGQVSAIVPLLTFLIGTKGYEAMKAHYAKIDAEAHAGQADYKSRFRLGKLQDVYVSIINQFDPKG